MNLIKPEKMLHDIKWVKVIFPEKSQKMNHQDKKVAKSTDDKSVVTCTSTAAHVRHTTSQLPKKRGQSPKSDGKKC